MNIADSSSIVLLPLDTAAGSMAAFPVAKKMAQLANATLHVIHVSKQPLSAKELRRELALTAKLLAGTVLDEVTGSPADSIVHTAEQQHSLLIVMAMYNIKGPKTWLGTVANNVLQAAPCPILFVQPDRVTEPWQLQRVLLPQDGAPGTALAVAPVCELTDRAHAKLFIVHVSDANAGSPEEPGTVTVPRYMDQPQHEWPAWSREFLDRIRGLCNLRDENKLRLFLTKGDPGTEIVRFAVKHKIDLIVLPWHKSLEPNRALAFKTVMRDAPCPILVLPVDRASLTAEPTPGHSNVFGH